MEITQFSIGDHVRVTDKCWQPELRGAVGIVSAAPEGIADKSAKGIFWIEFDPWITAHNPLHPTEAADVQADDLELIQKPASD
jgi:hypothetical protein